MDPNACLQRLKDAIAENDREEVDAARLDLRTWVDRGGYEPSDPDWRLWMTGRGPA